MVNSENEIYDVLTCPGTEVSYPIFPNDDEVWVYWKYSVDNAVTGKIFNVAVAVYLTNQARLKILCT